MSSSRALKDLLYEQLARLVKSMANAKRLELVELLCQAPKPVAALANEAGISMKLASAHLKELRHAHLIEADRQGRQVIYRIASPEVASLLVLMRSVAEDRLFELQHALRQLADSSEPWTQTDGKTLLRKAKKGEVTVIDVRPASEYDERHMPYARSLPLAELRTRLTEIPKDKPVIAYCRGPFCVLSVDAVTLLRENGFEAYQLREGAADWIASDS